MVRSIFKAGGLCHCRCPPSWGQIILVGLILTSASITSSCISVIYFSIKLHELKDFDYIYSYKPDGCHIVNKSVYEYNCSLGDRWMLSLLDDKDRKVVENPFAWRRSRSIVEIEKSQFLTGQNYSCVCRPPGQNANEDCQSWPRCILDTDFIKYIQRDNDRHKSKFISFIVVSIISIVLSAFFIPISCKTLQRELYQETYVPL